MTKSHSHWPATVALVAVLATIASVYSVERGGQVIIGARDAVVSIAETSLGVSIEATINEELGEWRARPVSKLSILEYRGELRAEEARSLRTLGGLPIGRVEAAASWEFVAYVELDLGSGTVPDLECSPSGEICSWRVPAPGFSRVAVITDSARIDSRRGLLIGSANESALTVELLQSMTSRSQRRVESDSFWEGQAPRIRERLASWAREHLMADLSPEDRPMVRVFLEGRLGPGEAEQSGWPMPQPLIDGVPRG